MYHQKGILVVSIKAILFPFPSSKTRLRAMSSANWTEVPGGRGLASMISKLETTAYPALIFPYKTKRQCIKFPQDWSEDLLTIPLRVLSSGPRFLDRSERGESPRG